MKKKYVLNERTAEELEKLISETPPGKRGNAKPVFTGRVTGMILCGSEISTNKYNGTIRVYNTEASTWESGESCILIPPYSGKLIEGKSYGAIRYGTVDESGIKSLWVSLFVMNCIEVVTDIDITCSDGVMTVNKTKECIYYLGEVRYVGEYGTCCDDMGGY